MFKTEKNISYIKQVKHNPLLTFWLWPVTRLNCDCMSEKLKPVRMPTKHVITKVRILTHNTCNIKFLKEINNIFSSYNCHLITDINLRIYIYSSCINSEESSNQREILSDLICLVVIWYFTRLQHILALKNILIIITQ